MSWNMFGPSAGLGNSGRTLVVAVFGAILGFLGLAAHAAKPKGMPTPLTSVGAVSNPDAPSDPDDPGTGGSFETTSYFRNRLTGSAAIADCASMIEKVAVAWAGKFSLSRSFRELHPRGLTLQYVKGDLKGLFELTYKVELQTHARVTVNFYAQDGSMLDPASIQSMLTQYQIGMLEDSLDVALRCGKQGL